MAERARISGGADDVAAIVGAHLRGLGWTAETGGDMAGISLLIHQETDETLPDTAASARALAEAMTQGTSSMIVLLDRRGQEIPEGIGDHAPWVAEALTKTLARDLAPRLRLNTVILDHPWLARGTEIEVSGALDTDLPAAITLLLNTPAMTGQTVRLAIAPQPVD